MSNLYLNRPIMKGYTRKILNAFNNLEDDIQIFRVMTSEMEKWKYLLESHFDVDVEPVSLLQEHTEVNANKTCDEMNLPAFTLHGTINTICDILLIINSDSELSNRISNLLQTANEFTVSAQSAGKNFPITYFCIKRISNYWINQPEKCEKETESNELRHENIIYSLMPRIFVSATEHKYYNRIQQSRAVHKADQDSPRYHMLSRRRRKHHAHTKKYKLLSIYREKGTKCNTQEDTSDVLEVPNEKRKSLCKYRKSCYNTGIIPNTRNIYDIIARFISPVAKENSSDKASTIEMQIWNDDEGKKEISVELKLLCRYRRSCYEMGAGIEKNVLKDQAALISSSRDMSPATKQKSTKTNPKMAPTTGKLEPKIAILQPAVDLDLPVKVNTEKNPSEYMGKTKKHSTCKYRKSCYDSGVLPEINNSFDNLVRKIYHFLMRQNYQTGMQNIIHKKFKDYNDDEKRVHCKYRKSCYRTGVKPMINHSQIFEYMITVKKYEEMTPLEKRCKYRKSCYDTGILPDLRKTTVKEEPAAISVKTVSPLHYLKTLCKYRKSCYKRKTEEQENLNELNEDKEPNKDESAKNKEKVVTSSQQHRKFISGKTKATNAFTKTEQVPETKSIKETDKKLIEKSRIFSSRLKEDTAIPNEEFEGIVNKPRKMKTRRPAEDIPTRSAKKVHSASNKLQENRLENFKMTYLAKQKQSPEKSIPLTLRCKYRKSCYESGKLPPIKASTFQSPITQVGNELSEGQLRIRCKYRKSCYKSGTPPLHLNHTAYVVTTSTERHGNLQLKCKYRKSCFKSMELDMQLDKVRKKEDRKKMQEGLIKTTYRTESGIKHKKNEQKKEVNEDVLDKVNKRPRKTKSKEPKSEAKEQQYMQIEPLNSQIQEKNTKFSAQKLKCKYRLKCYNSVPLQQITEHERFGKQQQSNIKDFRRADGAICSPYYISCRKQAGLPIVERAPIGPSGRRLCRKKKKEISYQI